MIDLLTKAVLDKRTSIWNEWRRANLSEPVVFQDIDFRQFGGRTLYEFDFTATDFHGCTFENNRFENCSFDHAHFEDCTVKGLKTTLYKSSFKGAELRRLVCTEKVDFSYVRFDDATLDDCTFQDVNLTGASFIHTTFKGGLISECYVYGTTVWNVSMEQTKQHKLRIESYRERNSKSAKECITVDDLQIAQFIHLLLDRKHFENFFNTVTTKAVLILGRFTEERKLILEAIAEGLKKHDYVPVIFDFDKPDYRDFTETITVLAGISAFVVADITNPKSAPLELQATVPQFMIPFVPIIQKGETAFSMFRDLRRKYRWVLGNFTYDSLDHLTQNLEKEILERAQRKRDEIIREDEEEGA